MQKSSLPSGNNSDENELNIDTNKTKEPRPIKHRPKA